MRKIYIISAILLMTLTTINAQKSFYDFTVKDINGEDFDLSQFKGKKVMVVNVASKCGLTPQYEQLEAIYQKYGGDDFVIIGFPANNFMKQEPGTDEEIKEIDAQIKKETGVEPDDFEYNPDLTGNTTAPSL